VPVGPDGDGQSARARAAQYIDANLVVGAVQQLFQGRGSKACQVFDSAGTVMRAILVFLHEMPDQFPQVNF